MSAAFQLTPVGNKPYYYHCVVCGRSMVEYGDHTLPGADLCDSKLCLDAWCRRQPIPEAVVMCSCSQRPLPHPVTIHEQLRSESYNPKLRFTWPWSLMLSARVELSTERKAA